MENRETDNVSKNEIQSDFGSGTFLDPKVTRAAARTVAWNVLDAEECKIVLDMLGLIPPQPGFEPLDAQKEKNIRAYETAKANGKAKEHNRKRQQRREEARKASEID